MTLEIFDGSDKLVRRYSSAESMPAIDPKKLDIPAAWVHSAEPLSAAAGMHRFVWDLHYPARAEDGAEEWRMAAMFGFGGGPWAVPGDYTVRLTAGGQSYSQPLTVKMDPRVKISQEDLQKQLELGAANAGADGGSERAARAGGGSCKTTAEIAWAAGCVAQRRQETPIRVDERGSA